MTDQDGLSVPPHVAMYSSSFAIILSFCWSVTPGSDAAGDAAGDDAGCAAPDPDAAPAPLSLVLRAFVSDGGFAVFAGFAGFAGATPLLALLLAFFAGAALLLACFTFALLLAFFAGAALLLAFATFAALLAFFTGAGFVGVVPLLEATARPTSAGAAAAAAALAA